MAISVHFYQLHFVNYTEKFQSLLDKEIVLTQGKEIPHPASYEVLVHPTPKKWAGSQSKPQGCCRAMGGYSRKNQGNSVELS